MNAYCFADFLTQWRAAKAINDCAFAAGFVSKVGNTLPLPVLAELLYWAAEPLSHASGKHAADML